MLLSFPPVDIQQRFPVIEYPSVQFLAEALWFTHLVISELIYLKFVRFQIKFNVLHVIS